MGRPPPNWSYRVGCNQRAVTRALLAYGKEFTTAELLRSYTQGGWGIRQRFLAQLTHRHGGNRGC